MSRIYLLAEGQDYAPTETVQSVHTTLAAAVGFADEHMSAGIGQWQLIDELTGLGPFTRIWAQPPDPVGSKLFITEWETVD